MSVFDEDLFLKIDSKGGMISRAFLKKFNDLADIDGNLDADELKKIFKKIDIQTFEQINENISSFLNFVEDEYKSLATAIFNKLLERYGTSGQDLNLADIQQTPRAAPVSYTPLRAHET